MSLMLTDISSIPGFKGIIDAQPFDPSSLAAASVANIDSVRTAADVTRSIVESYKQQTTKAVAAADTAVSKGYSATVLTSRPDTYVTAFTPPAYTPVTPATINSNSKLSMINDKVLASQVTESLIGEDKSPKFGPLKDSVAQGATLSTAMQANNGLPTDVSAMFFSDTATSLASNVLREKLLAPVGGEAALSKAAVDAVASDDTGTMVEGLLESTTKKLGEYIPAGAKDKLTSAFDAVKQDLGGAIDKVGGINLDSPTSFFDSIDVGKMADAVISGDVGEASAILGDFSKNKGIFSDSVIDLACNVANNPADISNYVDILDELDINMDAVLKSGASFGEGAVKSFGNTVLVDSGIISQEQLNGLTTKLSTALNSDRFKKLCNVGDKLARRILPSDTFTKLSASTDLASSVGSNTGMLRAFSSNGKISNRSLLYSTERLTGSLRGSSYSNRFAMNSDLSSAISDARYILK